MHILILGGSTDHPGGVEAFCERSIKAISGRSEWRIAHLPTGTAYLSLSRIPSLLRGISSVIQYRSKRPDCVWLQYVNLPDLAYLAVARLLGLPVMVTPHLGSNWRSQSNTALRWLSGILLGLAGRLALISPTQELELRLPTTVPRSSIRNFLPSALLQADLPPPEESSSVLQLLHSGRLSEGKGTFLFVEVCASLRAAGVPFFARITGGADAKTSRRLTEVIARYHLEKYITVMGRIPDSELVNVLRKSDVLLHLSRIDSYPLIVLEAMACSTFPICMELAGARDMVTTYDGHIVSESGSIEETVAFLSTQELSTLRARAAVAGARVRADYSWDLCAAALQSALRASVPHIDRAKNT